MRLERTLPSIRMHCSPSYFFEGCDTFVFFGPFAFGLRASLFDRSCPLAMLSLPQPCCSWLCCRVGRDARVEARLEPLEQIRPCCPRVRASFNALSHVWVRNRHCPQPVGLFMGPAPFRRIFGLLLTRDHLVLRLAAARASRAFE